MQTAITKDTELGTHLSDLKAFLTHFESVVSEQLEKTSKKTDSGLRRDSSSSRPTHDSVEQGQ